VSADQESTPPSLLDTLRDSLGPSLETALDLASRLWWFWLLFCAVLLGRFTLYVIRQRRLARSGIREIDAMDGRTFERYLETVFRRLGYKVELTKYRGDFGADLVVRKDGRRIAVQAKRYSKNVGVKAVQEAVAAKGYYDADEAMVVTNGHYTRQAAELARKNGVTLWDRERLISVLLESKAVAKPPPNDESEKPGFALDAPAVCATCGAVVSEKVRAYCVDNAERFGGSIYCFRHQRRRRAA
jgi:restriction system protein